jgi:hypothetical protein
MPRFRIRAQSGKKGLCLRTSQIATAHILTYLNRHQIRSGVIREAVHLSDITCPRCRHVGLVRFETVIKAGIAYKTFYCGRCQHTWRSADLPHDTESPAQTDDKAEPSDPTKDDT